MAYVGVEVWLRIFLAPALNWGERTASRPGCFAVRLRFVCRSETCTRNGHLHRVTCIPDVVLIQLILLMMRMGLLETCRELKYIQRKELCVNLVIFQEYKDSLSAEPRIFQRETLCYVKSPRGFKLLRSGKLRGKLLTVTISYNIEVG
jgi:hypothetical protein